MTTAPDQLPEGYIAATYSELVRSKSSYVQVFDHWATQLNAEQDNETGYGPMGALSWVHDHYNRGTQSEGSVFQTLILLDTSKPAEIKIVGTITICDDDRGVGAEKGLKQNAFIGFLQIARDYRQKGFGNYMLNMAEAQLDKFFEDHPELESHKTIGFTGDQAVMAMLAKHRYQETEMTTDTCIAGEKLFVKIRNRER